MIYGLDASLGFYYLIILLCHLIIQKSFHNLKTTLFNIVIQS